MTETLTYNERRFLSLLLAMIIFFVSVDLFTDFQEGAQWSHLLLELFIALGATAGVFILMKNSLQKSRNYETLQKKLYDRSRCRFTLSLAWQAVRNLLHFF